MRIAIEHNRFLSVTRLAALRVEYVHEVLVEFSEVASNSPLKVTINHVNGLSRIDNLEPVFINH